MKGRLAPSGVLGSRRLGPVYDAPDCCLFIVNLCTFGRVIISPHFPTTGAPLAPCQVAALRLKAADDMAGSCTLIGSYQRCTTSSMPAVSTIIFSGASARCAAGAPPPEGPCIGRGYLHALGGLASSQWLPLKVSSALTRGVGPGRNRVQTSGGWHFTQETRVGRYVEAHSEQFLPGPTAAGAAW